MTPGSIGGPAARGILAAILAIALLPAAACGRQDAGVVPPEIEIPFVSYRLANGLEVILREDHRVPRVAVNLWYRVGPANETKGSAGFAHLFEHMMLQGSGHAPGDYFRRLQAAGATGVNANTDLDRTSYIETVPSNQLELALWMESDRMGFLLDALDESILANQKAVARNERRQSIENAPYGLAKEELYRLLFPRGHPYRSSVLGSHADIQSATLSEVRAFFRRFYVPANASLSIAGDIDIPRAKALIEKYFGTLRGGRPAGEIKVPATRLAAEKRKTLTDRVELPGVHMAWHTGRAFSDEDAVATVTARLFGGGKASRLFENLVYRQKIAQEASARQRSLEHGSVFSIFATAKPGHTAAGIEKAINSELARLAESGPGEKELAATKSALIAIAVKSLEPFEAVADRLNAYNHFLGEPAFLNKDLRRYARVTAEDVREFAGNRLLKQNLAVVHVQPGEKKLPPEPPEPPPPAASEPQAPASEKEAWRNRSPAPAPAEPVIPPAAKEFELKNGLKVFVAPSRSLPLVTVRLVAPAGSASDPPGLSGVTDFMAAMLNESAGPRTAIDIADDLTALGSTLDTAASKERSWIDIVSLKPRLRPTMQIMRDVALKPTFAPAEVERVRTERLVALRQQADRPMITAYKVMWRELYGAGHPYAHLDLGTEEAIRSVRRDDLQAAYKRVFGPRNAALIFAGDISPGEARALAAAYFGDWKGEAVRPGPPPAPGPARDRVFIVDRPGSPQTSVLVAQIAVARSDPDFPKLTVMNRTLGGLFSSRLNFNLRETHGYTYAATSEITQNRGPGNLQISTAVNTEFTGPAIREALKEVARLKRDGITEQELKEATDSILFSVAELFDTNSSTVDTIATLYSLGIGQDNLKGLPGRLGAMSVPAISETAARYLAPDAMKIVLVGDRARIEPQLSRLGLGSVAYRAPDGSPA